MTTTRSCKLQLLKVGIMVSPCLSVRLPVSTLFSMLLGIGNAEIFSAFSLCYAWNADIMRIFLRIPVRILQSAFSPHFFPYKNAEISPRSCTNTPIRIFSAFPPHFFPYKNAENSPRSCPNTPIRIFSARKMRRSGVRDTRYGLFHLFMDSESNFWLHLRNIYWPLCGHHDLFLAVRNCLHLFQRQACIVKQSVVIIQLDEWTARRQLKSPRSLSGRSIHLTLITKWSWSWMTYCHPLCAMSTGPPILRYSYFKIWPWKSMVKVMCVVKCEGHIWPWKFTFEALEFNRYVCFSFRGNRTIFGWDIANSIFDLENSRSRSWQRSNPMVTFEP